MRAPEGNDHHLGARQHQTIGSYKTMILEEVVVVSLLEKQETGPRYDASINIETYELLIFALLLLFVLANKRQYELFIPLQDNKDTLIAIAAAAAESPVR